MLSTGVNITGTAYSPHFNRNSVINKCKAIFIFWNFPRHYLCNHWTSNTVIVGHIDVIKPKEHSAGIW